jgi:predicted GNAT family N-acyltransferase
MTHQYNIKQVSWASHEAELRIIREQVFIIEQHVPSDIEWDEHDKNAMHLLVEDKQQNPIGCARILSNGYIGRMALLQEWRGLGIGQALLEQAIGICWGNKVKQILLSAQTQVVKFYQKKGFEVISKPYMDANIWHVDMQLTK